MAVWDVTTPVGTEAKSLGDDRIREMKTAVQAALNADGGVFPGPNPTTAPVYYPVILKDVVANRPAASANYPGRMFIASDTGDIWRVKADGSAWELIYKNPGNNAIHQQVAAILASVAGVITLDETRNSYNITGTEAVTAIQGWSAGVVILQFASARTLTYNGATLVLKNGITRQVSAGEIAIFEFTGTNAVREIAGSADPLAPTRQTFLSGSGTYTTPAGCRKLRIRMVGGGGGGAAASTNAGSVGGDTSFNGVVAKGGGAGQITGNKGGAGGTGGVGSALLRLAGQNGADGSSLVVYTGNAGGGTALFGSGAGLSSLTQNDAIANTGGGGSSGGPGGNPSYGGGGGGEYVELEIASPAASYSYAVGAGGSGGAAGIQRGGNGGAGIIIVDELY